MKWPTQGHSKLAAGPEWELKGQRFKPNSRVKSSMCPCPLSNPSIPSPSCPDLPLDGCLAKGSLLPSYLGLGQSF